MPLSAVQIAALPDGTVLQLSAPYAPLPLSRPTGSTMVEIGLHMGTSASLLADPVLQRFVVELDDNTQTADPPPDPELLASPPARRDSVRSNHFPAAPERRRLGITEFLGGDMEQATRSVRLEINFVNAVTIQAPSFVRCYRLAVNEAAFHPYEVPENALLQVAMLELYDYTQVDVLICFNKEVIGASSFCDDRVFCGGLPDAMHAIRLIMPRFVVAGVHLISHTPMVHNA